MGSLTTLYGDSSGGGGLTPKFEEFKTSGTFTPSADLIAAGGYIEIFLVGGGGGIDIYYHGSSGGEVIIEKMYLTSTTGVAVTIGAGGNNNNGSASQFAGASAGGVNLTANGGTTSRTQSSRRSPGWGVYNNPSYVSLNAGNGVFGYGAGGSDNSYLAGGVTGALANMGQGGVPSGSSGYCLIKWYE